MQRDTFYSTAKSHNRDSPAILEFSTMARDDSRLETSQSQSFKHRTSNQAVIEGYLDGTSTTLKIISVHLFLCADLFIRKHAFFFFFFARTCA